MQAFNIEYKTVDAINEPEERGRLCKISGVTGGYPQVFLKLEGKDEEYIGNYDKILELVELNSMPDEELVRQSLANFHTTFEKARKKTEE